ncbi:hypothetical protein SUGI_0739890 [Cryptomeria japonica]|nr:hypothetical protein SUGI_0739890 [Cryptomeria japonica]
MGKNKNNKWKSLIELGVQDIPSQGNHFSSDDLEWTPIGVGGQMDLCAAIPLERLPHFVKGEGLLDSTETNFVRKKHRESNSNNPTDHTTKTYSRPDVAIITYNEFTHCDANGEFCHGKDDPSSGPRSNFAPRLSNECKSYIETLLLMGVGIDTICEQHYLDHGLTKLMNKRDTCLLRKDVLNAWKRVRSLRSQKNEDDAKSVSLWHVEGKDNFFYYKRPNNVENIPFVMGIQTPWMREMMVKHSHNSIIAMDSTFSTNKYGYELYTLLVFDEQEAGIPIAWAISSRNKVEDINEWLIEVYKRGKQSKEDWHVNAFMTDDASAEIEAIRSSFNCWILLCIWHVRRAWLKNVYRYVNNKDIATKGVTLLVDDDHDVRGSLSHENITTDSCVQLEDQDVSGVVIGEVQRMDSCVQLEDQDVSGVVIGEEQRTDVWNSFDASSDKFQNSIHYLNSLLQNLPTRANERNIFSECVERFRKDIDASLSSKFTPKPGSENMPIKRMPPWFSPSKMHKRHSIHQRRNVISQDLNKRVECENFQFPSIGCRKKKKKKVTNRSGIAIQEESLIIMQQQSLDDQANTRRHRLPFSIDLNQTITDEIDHIDDKICGDQPSMANVIPTQTFQQANPVLNDQQIHEEHMLPFPTDLNQTTTMDAMQTRDGSDDTIMEDHGQYFPG